MASVSVQYVMNVASASVGREPFGRNTSRSIPMIGSARLWPLPRHTNGSDLRHAAATFLLAQGFTLEDVKNLLGHSSIVLTSNTYGHVLAQRQQQLARGMDAVLGASG